MDANGLIDKLKASGTNDCTDLQSLQADYSVIYRKLDSKQRPTFALNVLCMLCRNIEKVPTWRENVDKRQLLEFSVECLRHTKSCNEEQKGKVLACHYHLHKYIVMQKLPSELVLHFSHMIFDECFRNYAKTYWAIIIDRLSYIETYKRKNADISKSIPHLTIDLIKLTTVYEIGQFFKEILSLAVKKLFYLYGENYSLQLSDCYVQLFSTFIDKDAKLKIEDSLEVFKKFNECSSILFDNGLSSGKFTINFIRDVYLKIFANKNDILDVVNIYFVDLFNQDNLLSILRRAENFESKPDLLTLNYFSNMVRLNVEHACSTKWREVPPNLQILLLKLVYTLMRNLVKCEQISKCDTCQYKSAMHDCLRISFIAKLMLTSSLECEFDVKDMLDIKYDIIQGQNRIIRKLIERKCPNVGKYQFKIQSNIHNLAILLYQKKYYDFSTKLFDLYLINEFQGKYEKKNIMRALYNKAINELDAENFTEAIKSAYLSLIFSLPEGLKTEKYISLIIDIKSKAQSDKLMTYTVLSYCENYEGSYGNLESVFRGLDFCNLLKYEYTMYCQLWPSTMPISGIWASFMDIYMQKYSFLNVDKEVSLHILMEIILKSIDVVRAIHGGAFKNVILQLLDVLEDKMDNNVHKMFYATLLLLKSELDYAEASERFHWVVNDKNKDPEDIVINRTMSQEYEVMAACLKGLRIWNDISHQVIEPTQLEWLPLCLPVLEFSTQFLLHLAQIAQAMQLACINMKLAKLINNDELYLKSASVILYHSKRDTVEVKNMIREISANMKMYLKRVDKETIFVCICDAVLYLRSIGREALAMKLFVEFGQQEVLNYYKARGVLGHEVTPARILEVFCVLCPEECEVFTKLSSVSTIQKTWYAVSLNKTTWLSRRTRSLHLKYNCILSTLSYTNICRHIMLWRRGRSAVSNAAGIVGASHMADLYFDITNTHRAEDAQTKIENRLKHILYSTELKSDANFIIEKDCVETNSNKVEVIETMLRAKNFTRTAKSPFSITAIPAFKMAEFLLHKNTCMCYQCSDPNSLVIALKIVLLESSMYFRKSENEIAKNYFEGSLKMVDFVISKLEHYCQNLQTSNYEQFLIEVVRDVFYKKLIELHIELLIEYSFFELSLGNVLKADDSIMGIHELLEENASIKSNVYLTDAYTNLKAATNKIKEKSRKNIKTTKLEEEFEKLELSPKEKELQKTPENKIRKQKQPVENAKIMNEDEKPKLKLKVIKLNLENTSPNKGVVEEPKVYEFNDKIEFKMPKSVKLQPEAITPRNVRTKPKIILTEPSEDLDCATPENGDFFTPLKTDETPISEDKFFTPMSTLKTYTKKSLRQQLVKNLEKDFVIYNDSDTLKPKTISRSKLKPPATKIGMATSKLESTISKIITSSTKLDSVKSENSVFNTAHLSTKSRTSSTKSDGAGNSKLKVGTSSSKLDVPSSKNVNSKRESTISKLDSTNSKIESNNSKLESATSKLESATSKLDVRKSTRDKRTLRRATSPGKLPNESKVGTKSIKNK